MLRRTVSPLLLLWACCAGPPKPQATPEVPAPQGVVVAPAGLSATPPPGLRLPGSLRALAQRVELTIIPSSPSFEGTTELDVELAASTDVLWRNARALRVTTASARLGAARATAQLSTSPDRVGLHFAKAIGPGRATLLLGFTGMLSDTEVSGLFHQQEGGDWYAMSKFEATDARRAFPCVDEPGAKIPWELTLRVPQALTAVSNTPVASTEPAGDGMKRVHFAQTKPLPSYLVAFGVGPYDVVEARSAGVSKVPMRVYTPKGRGAEAAYAARVSPELLEALEAYFAVPYPYEKLDLLTIPLSSGAMENAGLVSVTSNALLARKENETLQFQRTWASVGAHEFAHQWFGDLVTLAWWDDLWLNEAFATWMADKTLEGWAPSWGTQVKEVEDRSDAADEDSLETARSIRQPIETYDDIVNAFDAITYLKGAAVIRMFENYLGPEKFQKGVQRYLRAHANGNATASDFLGAISQATGQDVNAPFASFLDQSGVPKLTVELSCPAGKTPELLLSQQRLLPVGSAGADDRRWQVPVCARWSSAGKQHRACMLMTAPTATLALPGGPCPSWVLPNAGYTGYYRLALEGTLLKTLATRGRSSLTTPETVGLLGDVKALVTAGRFPQADGMELATGYASAPERQVAEQAIALAEVRQDFLEGNAAKAYPAWVRRHFGARARALGVQGRPGESDDTRLLRQHLVSFVARRGEDPELIQAAYQATERWLKDPTAVDPDMVNTVLTIAGTFGDASLHTTLVERLKSGPDRAIRARLLRALSSFKDPSLVKENLALVEAAPVDARELSGLLFGALEWPATRELAFQAVSEHFDLFASRLPERSIGQLFYTGSAFCDAQHRAAVKAAFSPRAEKALGGKRELAQTLEVVDLCIAKRAVQVPSVSAYLQRKSR
ncbi:MAG: M1 family aminopeptidase [Myxococcaceae bacterium]